MRKILILLFLIFSLPDSSSFDCSGVHESACVEFTYSGSFLKTPEERVKALNDFYEKYFPDSNGRKNISFELDSNNRIHIKSNEEIQAGSPIFTFQLKKILAQTNPNSMDFSQFIDKLERHPTHTASIAAKIGHSKFWDMKEKTIQLFWLHIANRNDSILGDYLNTLDENTFSPYLQFTDEEVDILKTIHEEYAHTINTKRNQIRAVFDIFLLELYTHYNREILYTMFRYPELDVNVRFFDFVFMDFFLEKLTYVQDGSYYIVPFLDLIRDDYTKTQYVSTQKNIKIVDDPDYNIHTLSILSDYLIDEASIVTKEYRRSAENLFIYDGVFDKNHPQECERVPLWESYMDGFKMTQGHANLYYYLPFPQFGLCYLNPEIDNHRITLLVRSLNMNEEQAQECYMKAKELQKIRGLSGKEFFQGLEEECYKPELKLNSRDIAKGELEAKMEKFRLISEKIQNATKKHETSKLPVKNLNFLNEYVTFKYELVESALKHIKSLPFDITELDLKQQKLLKEQMEEMKEKISITVNRNEGKKQENEEEESDDEIDADFTLEEKNEL